MLTRSMRLSPVLSLLCCHFYSVSAQVPSSGCTVISPAPANTICGQAGSNPVYAQTGDLGFASQTVTSLTACQDLCLRRVASGDASCANFNYDSSSSLCTITPEALQSITPNTASSVVFYQRACFSCPDQCSQQSLGTNILDNSGFEFSAKYLGPWFSSGGSKSTEQGGDVQSISKSGNGSKRGYSCKAGKAAKCSIRQSFTTCPDTVYKWSYDYKAANKQFSSFSATAYYDGTDNSHSLIYPNNSAATLQWQTYSDVIQLNSNLTTSALIFDLQAGKAGTGKVKKTYLADNIKIEPTNYVVGAEPGATNTLRAGGFESGNLAPWTKTMPSENVAIVAPGLGGTKYALKWTIKGPQTNPSFGIMQDFSDSVNTATVPGQAYLFNVDYTTTLPQGSGVRPLLYGLFEIFTGDDRTNITNSHNVYSQFHGGQIGTIRIPFQGQVNQFVTRLTIKILSAVPSGTYSVTIDNLSFKPLYTS